MIYNKTDIIAFWRISDDYGCFSQWYYRDIFMPDRITYCCNEQYMMYQKALLFDDNEIAALILQSKSPRDIKALGRKIKNFDEKIWQQYREAIVNQATYAKFTQHPDLAAKLLSTQNKIIVEASPYDNIWGIGLSEDDPKIFDSKNWGLNLLGKSLMDVRTVIAKVK